MIYTLDEWISVTKDRALHSPDYYSLAHQFDDIKGANYLANKMALAGYMEGPVGVHNGHSVAAMTIQVATLDEFIDKYSDGTQVFLYEVTFFPNIPIYETYDNKNGVVPLSTPEISDHMGVWKIRFGVLPQ